MCIRDQMAASDVYKRTDFIQYESWYCNRLKPYTRLVFKEISVIMKT
ncbi:hypothetical protein [Clostridioides difficile]|nr:hypothetical protein [Clostridioides difficile]